MNTCASLSFSSSPENAAGKVRINHHLSRSLLLLMAGLPLSLGAAPDEPRFDGFQRLGFQGGVNASSFGASSSTLSFPVSASHRPFAFDTGFAFGTSAHYNLSSNLGFFAWVQNTDTGTLSRLGLSGGAFTSGQSGFEWSDTTHAFSTGSAFGFSRIYRAGTNTENGQALWGYHRPTGTQARMGLHDAEHTGLNGVQSSALSATAGNTHVFSNANAFGHSIRYNEAGAANGQSAWGYHGATGVTSRFGLTGTDYTRSTGAKNSSLLFSTADGHAIGDSTRYNGNAVNGTDIWHGDLATGSTRIINLTGAGFESTTGYRLASASQNNTFATGHVFGISFRITDAGAFNGEASWHYSTATGVTNRLGYFDADHTRVTDGNQQTGAVHAFANGLAFGHSSRYLATTGAANGQSAWRYSTDGTLTALGLFGVGYENTSTGNRSSTVNFAYATGDAFGSSNRFSGTFNRGTDTWHHDAATGLTTVIGLTGGIFESSNGTRANFIHTAHATGHAFGSSQVYNGASFLGYAAWHHDTATGQNIRLGLTTPEHTGSGGQVNSAVFHSYSTGNAFGESVRYVTGTGTTNGNSIWAYHAASGLVSRAGLTAAEFTGLNNIQNSVTTDPFANGIAYGRSDRYVAASTSTNGQSVWHHDAATGLSTEMGLKDAAHTRSTDGYRFSNIQSIGTGVDRVSHAYSTGYAFGISQNYSADGLGVDGTSLWSFNAATGLTTRTGLQGTGYTRTNGTSFSALTASHANGHAFGTSFRFTGDSINGQGLWHHDAATSVTTRLGLFSADYTFTNDLQSSSWTTITQGSQRNHFENGNAFGESRRYLGTNNNNNKVAWVFEASTGQHTTALLAQNASGYTSSYWLGTNDDGTVAWGFYGKTPTTTGPGPLSTFFWTAADGLHDFNDYVEGGFAAYGITGNVQIQRVNADGSLYVSAASGTQSFVGLLQATKNRFWDTDGTTLGFGGNTGGTWNAATTTWGNSTGTGTTGALTADQRANFRTDGTAQSYTVEVDGLQTVSGLRFLGDQADITLADANTDGGIALAGGNALYVGETATARIDVVLSGAEGMDKTGLGTAILGAANTYSGGTTVSEGKLVLDHAQALGTGGVRVRAGATLDVGAASAGFVFANDFTISAGSTLAGSATYTGLVTIEDGAFLSPGNSPGTITLESGGLLENGSTYVWEIQGSTPSVPGVDFDQILVTGGELIIAFGAIIEIAPLTSIDYASTFWSQDRSFTVVGTSGDGFITGTFQLDTTQAGDFAPYGTWDIASIAGDQVLRWNSSSPIPEPSAYPLIAGILALATATLRRRR